MKDCGIWKQRGQNQNQNHCLSELATQNPRLYEQLKARETEYIDLIKDLHSENLKLRAMLAERNSQKPVVNFVYHTQHEQKNQAGNHARTPSFSSATNAQEKSMQMRETQNSSTGEIKNSDVDPGKVFSNFMGKSMFEVTNDHNDCQISFSRSDLQNQKQGEIKKYIDGERLWKINTQKTISKGENQMEEIDMRECVNCKKNQIQQKKGYNKSIFGQFVKQKDYFQPVSGKIFDFKQKSGIKSKQIITNKIYL